MDLEMDQIHVAEYWLQLPPQKVLRERLRRALLEIRTSQAHSGSGVDGD